MNMIDENEIMPFNFFSYGGIYSGDHHGMRYVIKRKGDKPDFILSATVWPGPFCYAATDEDKKTEAEFDYSEDGRREAIEWIKKQYDDRKEEWDNAPSVLEAEVNMDGYLPKEVKEDKK